MKIFLYSALIGITALTIVGGSVALAQGMGFGQGGADDTKAEILGMTVEELDSQLETKTFLELLDEQGVSHTQLREQMQANHLARATVKLQARVDDGSITQEEMNQRLEDVANGEGHGFKGRGGHMGQGRGMHEPLVDENGDGVCDYMENSEVNEN